MFSRAMRLVAPAVAVGSALAVPMMLRRSWLEEAAPAAASDEDLFIVRPALDPTRFQKFRVREIEPVSHNTKRIRFSLPSEHHELGLPIASCLVTKATIDGEEITRPYTPTTKEHQKGHFDLIIKSYESGKMSKYLTSLNVGDEVEMKGPFTKLAVERNAKKAIGMVAGGTGITPMLQVLDKLLDDPRDNTEIRLLFANVSPADILLKSKLDALALIHPRFKVYYTVDSASEGWSGFTGHVTPAMLAHVLPPPSDDNLILVCGPPGLVKVVSGEKGPKGAQGDLGGFLKDMKYTPDQVFKF